MNEPVTENSYCNPMLRPYLLLDSGCSEEKVIINEKGGLTGR